VVLALILLLWAVDAVARVAAQSVASQRIQAAAGLDGRPEVRVRGPLFLPQLFGGSYGRLEVDLDEVIRDGLRLAPAHVDLHGLRLPFGDLVGGAVDRVEVERTTARAQVGYDDLNRWLAQQGQQLTVSAGPSGGARVDGSVSVAGQPVQVGGEVSLSVEDGRVRVSPAPAGGEPSATPFAFTLPLGDLPYGQRLTAVRPGPQGLQVEAEGTDVVLER